MPKDAPIHPAGTLLYSRLYLWILFSQYKKALILDMYRLDVNHVGVTCYNVNGFIFELGGEESILSYAMCVM